MAESSLSFSAILSKYAQTNNVTTQATTPVSRSTALSNGAPKPSPQSRMTAVGRSRPGGPSASVIAANKSLPAASYRAGVEPTKGSPKPGNLAAINKRNLDAPVGSRPLTGSEREMLERKKKLLEKVKLKREKRAGLSASARTAPTKPTLAAPGSKPMSSALPKSSAPGNPSSDSKKMSYKEMLARAAKLQDDQKKLGVITHKPRAPVQEKKEWQKKLEAKQSSRVGLLPSEKKNSMGPLSTGDKVGLVSRKGKEVIKPTQTKKVGGDIDGRRPSAAKGKLAERSRPTEPFKRKRSPSPISWRGKKASASAPSKKPSSGRRGRGRYDEDEDEDDDWIVDDDEVETNYSQRYRYAESDYESDSDMEAAGLDILEEEDRSRRNAIKEDAEQERLERELAIKKATMKKKLAKK